MSRHNKIKVPTQAERLLSHLQSGESLLRIEAWNKLGIIEAPARISELRAKGHKIKTDMISVKNRYGEPVSIASWSMDVPRHARVVHSAKEA